MRWQLRVLNGSERGKTFALEARLTIGRAPGSDLQLVAQEVSRQHARIVEDEDGHHVIVDLDSGNGTYVDGMRVRAHALEPFAEITIGDVELIYEPMPRGDAAAPTPRSELAQPMVVARNHAPTTLVGAAVPPGAIRDRDGRALVFELPDGREYEGNLLADVIEYRTQRARQLRGGLGDPAAREAFEQLKARLQQPPSSDARLAQRAFCRFACWLPGRIRLATGEELPCHVRDVGVDGAQIVAEGLRTETTACLMVEVIEAGERRVITFTGRVAWTDGGFAGLAFAGAPRREDGRYAQRAVHERLADQDTTRSAALRGHRGARAAEDPRRG